MDSNQAIKKINNQKLKIEELKTLSEDSPEFKKWRRDTEVGIEKIFGKDSRNINDFQHIQYDLNAWSYDTPEAAFQLAYIKGLKEADYILQSFIEEIENYPSQDENTEINGKNSSTNILEKILLNFHLFARQIQSIPKHKEIIEIENEYDIQNLLYSILKVFFDDVRPEEFSPSFGGSNSRVDFLLKKEKIVIEVKFASHKLKEKEIGNQLIIDIKKYQTHPDCKQLYCFVYDPNQEIHNPAGLENDLSGKHDKIEAKILVVPH